MRHAKLVAFGITIGMISYRDIRTCHDLPWPPRFIFAAIMFAMIEVFSIVSEELANVMTVGIVLAAIVSGGFKAECDHAEGTVQPDSYQSLKGGSTGTLA